MKIPIKIILVTVTLIFAFIGLLFTAVFVAMQFNLLNVSGSIKARNNSIISVNTPNSQITDNSQSVPEIKDSCPDGSNACDWMETSEWNVVAGGLTKDIDIIKRVSSETGVSSRLIASVVVPEQLRFFTSEREVFKRYFEPLKILGSLSKFSLGVSGIKQETAVAIEQHAKNPDSAFFPGDASYAKLLEYDTDKNHDALLYGRLTDDKDHYYSYLYTAIFIKEILAQWERAGYDISNRADIISTIFNIGFSASNPNPNPQVGGAHVTVGGTTYTFGELAGLFYDSNQLPDIK